MEFKVTGFLQSVAKFGTVKKLNYVNYPVYSMEEWSISKLIRAGFWAGVGFIMPLLILLLTVASVSIYSFAFIMNETLEIDNRINEQQEEVDDTKIISILSSREQKIGHQLFIQGELKNTGDYEIYSVVLEAELLDEEGKLVYQCDREIHKVLKKDETVNYQIECYTGEIVLPEYKKIKVRVVNTDI